MNYVSRKIETPIGTMVALADDGAVCFLGFDDVPNSERDMNLVLKDQGNVDEKKTSAVLDLLERELKRYCAGELAHFTTPIKEAGTAFQLNAWRALRTIAYGETRSYQEQASVIDHPLAHRAVANANGRNKISIIVPCHRIIKHDGSLGGYGGRVDRKAWLLELERQHRRKFS